MSLATNSGFRVVVLYACHLVQLSDRGESELPNAIDLLIQSGRTIDAIRLDGWWSCERVRGRL